MLATLEMLGMARVYTVTLMIGTNDVSRGEARKATRLHDKMSCILEELRIQMDPAILTVCTIPYNMKADQNAMEMNTKVRNLNEIIRQIHQRSVLPVGLLDVAEQMVPDDATSPTQPPRDRTGGLQKTSADPSKCDHDGVEKSW